MCRIPSLVLVCAALLMAGCTSLGKLEQDAKLQDNKTIFVIGVAPENYRVSVFPGNVEDGAYKQNPWRPAAVFGAPDNGYLVGEADAGDTLAIAYLRIVSGKDDLLGADYIPCAGRETLVFGAPANKVIYLTDVRFSHTSDSINMAFNDNLDAARAYIDKAYPNLKGQLEKWAYKTLPVNASCTRTIYIPRT